jgi:neutral ceramidase
MFLKKPLMPSLNNSEINNSEINTPECNIPESRRDTADRRQFLTTSAWTTATWLGLGATSQAHGHSAPFQAGEGVVDTTPPIGIELGGFHGKDGEVRLVEGIRQPTAARALVLEKGESRVALISLDICTVSESFSARVQKQVARLTGIPPGHVHLCATHTHSMPAFSYLRQWGAIPVAYMDQVEKQCVEAVLRAKEDLALAELYLGKSRAIGANFNRTTDQFQTDERFTDQSTDQTRWLDTMLYVLQFQRQGRKPDLVWYHFSGHPVCHADGQAGPDWPGAVAERIREETGIVPSFLQGHAGDVNPGDGDPWRGDLDKTATAVSKAMRRAMERLEVVPVDRLVATTKPSQVPLDMMLLREWLLQYRENPEKCVSGPWVDAGFAADWYEGNKERDLAQTEWPITLSAIALGPVGLVFHPAELYSVYGLTIRRDSPFADTLVVGYADGIIGYLTDPLAYEAGEYGALTVPKILDIPPFTPIAARRLTAEILATLNQLV